MPQQSLKVIARIKAKPEAADQVRELLRGLIEPSRREPGCVSYELMQNRLDPTDFTFVEEWTGDADLAAHASSGHINEVGPKLLDVVAEAPDIRTYSVVV